MPPAGIGRPVALLRERLRRAGIEVHRTGRGPRRTLTEVLDHLRNVGCAPRTVVDVGVAAGTPELYDAFPAAELLLVEPLSDDEPRLRERLGGRHAHVARVAAGAHRGEREIAVHRVRACSSVLGDRRGDSAGVDRRRVEVVPLDDLLAERGLQGPFVVKADVEGAELEVLEGARRTLQATEVVLLEVNFFQFVPGGALLADVVRWMDDHGWAPYDVYHGHVRPLDGALAQLDMAFVPRDGRLRADQRYATEAQADRLYRSWGL